jgi:F-type H+-transporting ATPase subunit delta
VAERATVARPYAKAAFDYARTANAFAPWSRGLAVAAEIVADQRVAALAKSPSCTAEDLLSLIADVAGGQLDAGMQNFIRLLIENRRLLLLPEIAVHYEALRAAVENTVDVEVISAVALDAAQSAKLSAALSTRLKRAVRMSNSVDATLLGGAVIRAGDLVIDGSLKGRLERLGTELGTGAGA